MDSHPNVLPSMTASAPDSTPATVSFDTDALIAAHQGAGWKISGWAGNVATHHAWGCTCCHEYINHLIGAQGRGQINLRRAAIGTAINTAWPGLMQDFETAANEKAQPIIDDLHSEIDELKDRLRHAKRLIKDADAALKEERDRTQKFERELKAALERTASLPASLATQSPNALPTKKASRPLPQPEAGPSRLPPPQPEAELSQGSATAKLADRIAMEVDDIPEWLSEEQGYVPPVGPPAVSKRRQKKGLGPPIPIGGLFDTVEELQKDYLAHAPGNSLKDPTFLQEREGILNLIAACSAAIKSRPTGPVQSIALPVPYLGNTFPWKPVPEHLASLPGIGEPLSRGDPPRSQTGRLPRPLGRTSARTAQWFDLCHATEPFFIETVEKVKRIPAAERTWEMHAIHRRWRESVKAQKPLCFKIRDGTPADMVEVLSLWQHNPEGVPTAIRQEDDGSLNTSDVDIWMWLKTLTPIKGVMV